ncbi:MAG: NUDIX domain-containing protein [Acidobacteria bacterium]|nr:NUDIX domain-containing protein [Acidobacteriota bacterium]
MDAVAILGQLSAWSDPSDGEASKSRELVVNLLRGTPQPYSRDQFEPGHLTATACVLHPFEDAVLLVHHAKLDRWLLPGGHVEAALDATPSATARREAEEESGVRIDETMAPALVGIDVHSIPARKKDPYHLHHDLIYRFRAAAVELGTSEEIREAVWCREEEFDKYDLPSPIRRAVWRSLGR